MKYRCPSCHARIMAALGETDPAKIAARYNDCTCDPLNRPTVGGASMLPEHEGPRGGSNDPGWKDDEDAMGSWSRVVRAMEDR